MSEKDIQTSPKRLNELQQQLHQWHEVFLNAGYPTMILDDQYRIQAANKALLELTNCPFSDIQNKHCYTLFHGTEEPPPNCPCEVEITQGNSVTTEMPVEQFNRFFLVSCKPLNIPGLSAPRYIHVATDVTEQRQFADKLQAINQQKELLIQELFHRTKNNMQMINSMLRLYGSRFTDEQAREAARNIEIKIQTMSLIHQKLFDHNDLCNIKMDDFFGSLVALIKQQYSPQAADVLFVLEVQPLVLNIDIANPLALVVNELITNAIRHAFPQGCGEIHLTLIQQDDQLKLNIQDTGTGIPTDIDMRTSTSLGMMLVYSQITQQLQGSINYTNNNGLCWNISLPLTQHTPRF